MQKLFYVVCRWLQEDSSRQSFSISNMIKEQMEQVGFNYDSISNTERQREQLYREREKLIREKQKLEEQKRQIEQERQHNLRLIQEKQRLQREREQIEQKLHEEKEQTETLKEENQQLEEKRRSMVEEYERLQDERDKIIEERQLLYERMQKIQQLQRLQRMYQEQLRRLREQTQTQTEPAEEEKTQQEEQNEIHLQIPPNEPINQIPSQQGRFRPQLQSSYVQMRSQNSPVHYGSGFSSIISNPHQYGTQNHQYGTQNHSFHYGSSRYNVSFQPRMEQQRNLTNRSSNQKKDQSQQRMALGSRRYYQRSFDKNKKDEGDQEKK